MKTNNNEPNTSDEQITETDRTSPTLLVDYQKYAHFLENTDLTELEKREFIDAIWGIIVDFVALGFDVHPAQQVGPQCEQSSGDESEKNLPVQLTDMVSLGQPNQQKKNKAKRNATRRPEREES